MSFLWIVIFNNKFYPVNFKNRCYLNKEEKPFSTCKACTFHIISHRKEQINKSTNLLLKELKKYFFFFKKKINLGKNEKK